MLERHTTAERINEIANDPSILPWIQGDQSSLDFSSVVSDENHIFLVGKYGYVHFIKMQPGIYQFHTCVLPEGRGQWMLDGAQSAFHWMFCKTDAFELMTHCPNGNLASKAGARAVGCTFSFRTKEIWPFQGKKICLEVWSIILQNWVRISPYLVESGKLFHSKLEKLGEVSHDDDEEHDRQVGCAVEMIRNGRVSKGVSTYNRWSLMAGYQPISVHSQKPLIIDIGSKKLLIENETFEII